MLNYKDAPIREQLAQAVGEDGVDAHDDNVAATTSRRPWTCSTATAGWRCAARSASTTLTERPCGPDTGHHQNSPRSRASPWVTTGRHQEHTSRMTEWLTSGKIAYDETVVEGSDDAVDASIDMMKGANTGKMVVKIEHRAPRLRPGGRTRGRSARAGRRRGGVVPGGRASGRRRRCHPPLPRPTNCPAHPCGAVVLIYGPGQPRPERNPAALHRPAAPRESRGDACVRLATNPGSPAVRRLASRGRGRRHPAHPRAGRGRGPVRRAGRRTTTPPSPRLKTPPASAAGGSATWATSSRRRPPPRTAALGRSAGHHLAHYDHVLAHDAAADRRLCESLPGADPGRVAETIETVERVLAAGPAASSSGRAPAPVQVRAVEAAVTGTAHAEAVRRALTTSGWRHLPGEIRRELTAAFDGDPRTCLRG
ncbi:hypothetical protein QJS66_13910 [Kocuria rhizophila]|nr:hypothetical protein QJS66_13910 [Kocuria rhizophila]